MKEQANLQFQKLLEIAEDIQTYGTNGGNQQKRNIVISGLVNTENEYLYQMLDKALVDNSQPDILHTLICGIYLHKNRFASLAEYVDHILKDATPINEKFENKEALLLCAEGLIKSCMNEDKTLASKFLPTIKNLFISSCLEDSTSILADKLLQSFLTRMSVQNEMFSQLLREIIENKTSDFNARLVAIDILTRVDKPLSVEIILNIFEKPNDYAPNGVKLLYLLDVTTKAIKFLKPYFEHKQIIELITTLNNLEYSVSTQDEYAQSIVQRIKNRINDINDDINSLN